MKKYLMADGKIREVSESYGRRLIEQGKAIPAPEKAEEKKAEEKAEEPKTEARETGENESPRKTRKK